MFDLEGYGSVIANSRANLPRAQHFDSGETLYNRRNITQGQTDVPLSNVGQQQAKLVGRRLENDSYTHIFSSDLSRALQTAQNIIESNKSRKCTILKDKRLRERKFGVCEGKTSKEFIEAAKKANLPISQFTPPGAETVAQLKERAQSFFRDLCKLLAAFVNDTEDTEYTPGSIKRRHGGSLGRNSYHARNRLNNSHRSQSFCGIASIAVNPNEQEIYMDHFSLDQKRRKHERRNSEQDYVDENDPGILTTHRNDMNLDSVHNVEYSNKFRDKSELIDNTHMSDFPDGPIERSDSSSSGYSSLPDTENLDTECAVRLRKIVSENQPYSDTSRSNPNDIIIAHEYCPNVTLSPMLSHRLSSVSSISSGRNGSFDDVDCLPLTIADVLVVSHGGILKELIRHFIEDLDCKVPNKGHALKMCPNCSISKFIVSLQDLSDTPVISCILLHDKDHLVDMDIYDEALGKY